MVKATARTIAHANRIRAFIGLPPWSLKPEVTTCRATRDEIGICGQVRRDYRDLAEWLADEGTTRISHNPETVQDAWLLPARR